MFSRILLISFVFLLAPFAWAAGPFSGTIEARPLANGLRVIVRENHAMPLVAMDLWVRSGSAEEADNQHGAAHFLEHALFKGSAKYGLGDIDRQMENLGGTLEASTSRDWIHFYSTVASRYFPNALRILADMVSHPTLPESEMDHERSVILDEIVQTSAEPFHTLQTGLALTAYGRHPYGRPVPGDVAAVTALTRAALVQYMKRCFVGSNMALVVVGDVDPQTAFSLAGRDLAGIPRGTPPSHADPPLTWHHLGDPPRPLPIRGSTAYLAVGFPAPAMKDADDVLAMDLLYTLLGEGPEGRLERELVGSGLAERVHLEYATQRWPGLFSIALAAEPGKIEAARDALWTQLNALRAGPVPDAELASAKARLLTTFAFDNETYAGQAATLGYYEAIGSYTFAQQYADLIARVSASDLQRAASHYLQPSRAVSILAQPAPVTHVTQPAAPSPSSGQRGSSTLAQAALHRGAAPGGSAA